MSMEAHVWIDWNKEGERKIGKPRKVRNVEGVTQVGKETEPFPQESG